MPGCAHKGDESHSPDSGPAQSWNEIVQIGPPHERGQMRRWVEPGEFGRKIHIPGLPAMIGSMSDVDPRLVRFGRAGPGRDKRLGCTREIGFDHEQRIAHLDSEKTFARMFVNERVFSGPMVFDARHSMQRLHDDVRSSGVVEPGKGLGRRIPGYAPCSGFAPHFVRGEGPGEVKAWKRGPDFILEQREPGLGFRQGRAESRQEHGGLLRLGPAVTVTAALVAVVVVVVVARVVMHVLWA